MSRIRSLELTALLGILFIAVQPAYPHCDGMDGPVVMAAQKALAAENVNLVLIWVQAKDERQVRDAFAKTLAVRKLNVEARELADLYFFETVVRIHRAGEGEPYTGLKPAGRDLGPAIPAADKAIQDADVEPLVKLIAAASQAGIRERFQAVLATKNFDASKDSDAGRRHVKAYVEFVTYVETMYATAHGDAHERP